MKINAIFLSLFSLVMLTACSGDVADSGADTEENTGAEVTLTVSALEANSTGIATRAFEDTHATDGEMMKNYIIVAVNETTSKITHILQSETLDNKEKDTYSSKVHFDTGTYTFYTFANLTLDQLGLATAKVGDAAPDFDSKTLAVDGNQTSVTAFANGIPMSYKQTVSINAHTAEVNLYVMRMVAKMTLRLTNATGNAMTLNSVTLSDITKNAYANSDTPNLFLLTTTAKDANGKEQATPRLTDAATLPTATPKGYDTYTITPSTDGGGTGLTIPSSNASAPKELTFYINESQAHDPANLELTLYLTTTQADGTPIKTTSRYTILNWNKIARNDYRVIPITLDDYKLTFDVQYFTAIGVLPPTVTDDGQTLDLDFSYYGDIHLVPKIKRWSDGKDAPSTVTPTYATKPWTLVTGKNPDGFFAKEPSWNSAKNCVDASLGFTAGTSAVYRLQCTITKADGTTETLSRNVRFKMTPMSFGAKAATRAADRSGWHWISN